MIGKLKPTTFEEALDEVLAELRETLLAKQHDYGHNNITDFGEIGVIVRMNDKMARIKNLTKAGRDPKNEPIVDSYKDLAGYGVIALMLRRGTFTLPLDADLTFGEPARISSTR